MVSGFHIPESAREALELKASLGEGARFLGGGSELNSQTSQEEGIEDLISLARVNSKSIEFHGGEIIIGAAATIQEILEAEELPEVLHRACLQVENRSIRNQATIGGHVAAAHPYASVLPLLIALDAKLDLLDADLTPISLGIPEYLDGAREGLITAVRIPTLPADGGAAVAQYRRSTIDLALLSVAVFVAKKDAAVSRSRIVVGGPGPLPQRLIRLEESLEGSTLPPREQIESMVREQVRAETDPRATAEFRKHMAGVLVAKALLEVAS